MSNEHLSSEQNTGHGHVRPRPDGVKARCGGPSFCAVCAKELASLPTHPLPPFGDSVRHRPSNQYLAEKRCCSVCDRQKVCHVCKQQTLFACSDCRMNFGAVVYVCTKTACRDEHERKCFGTGERDDRRTRPAAETPAEQEPEDDPANAEIVAKLKAAFAGPPDERALSRAMRKLADGAINVDNGIAILTHAECDAVGKELRRLVQAARQVKTSGEVSK